MQEILKSLEPEQRSSSGRIDTWKDSKGRIRSRFTSQKIKSRRKRCPTFGQKSLISLNGWLKFSEGESLKICGSLDPVDQWEN